MTVYRSQRRIVDPATSGSIPVVRRRRTALRWLLTVVVLVLFVNLLLVQAYASARFAPDSQPVPSGPAEGVPAGVQEGGPIIDASGPQPRSKNLPAHTIALTFDDGPDPKWTPRILGVLRKHGVHATFFVVGSQVARNPALTRRLLDEGHEIGAHTFTHPRLGDIPGWRSDLELSQTQLALAYSAGITTSLLRPPYSSSPEALDATSWSTVRDAARDGYLTVLNDADSRDWEKPGVDAIVRNSTPPGDTTAGTVVLLHDAGGNRAQTVVALDRLIPQLKQRGYRFTTISEGMGGDVRPANPRAATAERWRGGALVWAVRVAGGTTVVLLVLLLVVGILTLARTMLLFLFSIRHARRRRSHTWSWGPPVTDPVSVVIPAFNESKTIGPAVRSLAQSAHHEVEVVVVDDASTDGTADVVAALGLSNVRVVRVPPGGKATALNTGAALASHDLLVMVDADTVVDSESIHRLVRPFADPTVGAVAGNVKVGNRRGILGRWQHIEYVIGFNLDRRLYDTFGCISTIPGALGAFRRQALVDAGGLSLDTIAEDTDLTIAIQRAGWQVVYEESALAYTEAPATLPQLWKQRYRWSYGIMQAIWKHRRAVFDRGPSGRFGRRALPFISLFSVLLPLLAPLLDILTIYGVFFLNRWETLAGWLAVLAVQIVTAILAFRLDGERLGPLWTLPLQQLVYRQIMYLVLLRSALTALTGRRLRWQKLRRSGEVAVPT